MPARRKIIHNPDSDSPRRSDREIDLQDWDPTLAQQYARQEGIELSDAHWAVIDCLREYYLEHGPVKSGREISNILDRHFAGQGGRKYLRRLFPGGPVAQGMRIAGLHVPAFTRDAGFGTSR